MSKLEVLNPLTKSAFKAFLSQVIEIQYFKQGKNHRESLENLKNLMFPPEISDDVFNGLIKFVNSSMHLLINTNKDIDDILSKLQGEFIFSEDIFELVREGIEFQREKIVQNINKKFEGRDLNHVKKVGWKTKIILQGDGENYLGEKYADVEISHCNENDESGKIYNKNITFLREDVKKVMENLKEIKNNLGRINGIN